MVILGIMETTIMGYMGRYQNCSPFLGTLNIRCRTIIGIQKRTTILTTTHMSYSLNSLKGDYIGDSIGELP